MRSYSFLKMFRKYVTSSVMLVLATILALIIANSSLSHTYTSFWNLPMSLSIGNFNLFSHGGTTLTVMEFINDFLMVVFFFSVGLEIKREILVGELSSVKKALLPVIGAIGGMLVPVLVFWLVSPDDPTMLRGAAIPMATDIAFSLGVLSTFGNRVPLSLKVFLAALAVADDLGGILIIALFYTTEIHLNFLLYALILIAILIFGNMKGVRSKFFYIFVGVFVWYCFLNSGIHATIAGVIVAFCIPATLKRTPTFFIERIRRRINQFPVNNIEKGCKAPILTDDQIGILKSIENASDHIISPLQDMEDSLHTPINYIVIPVFAFANAGIVLEGMSLANLFSGVGLAVFLGLVIGKFIGVFSFSWMAIKLGLVKKPSGADLKSFASVCALSGIGFTVAMFIADLSYDSTMPQTAILLSDAKIGILCGSLLSGIISWLLLNHNLPRPVSDPKQS
ncbi:Na+/H+ antiporter NhaA [Bacteroides sp. OF04-15BH]|uniref:Na+/H+ antiporter NhaA n=1 Tax=Bacteroides sp. OF04-15BH TaxID=2292281 RepID=UPI000E4EE017|nr:Na+/H+ antiporter NhaA [Bacteroides sp. OF04-15BH]RHP65708.1 Na+/H+ antiporter NhaA [Bacteroides sp. OF04-15BH]